jgi:hypothetical protein
MLIILTYNKSVTLLILRTLIMPLTPIPQILVTSNHLTQQQAENLSYAAQNALRHKEVLDLITKGKLPLATVLTISLPASQALWDSRVRELITKGTLTPEHIEQIKTVGAVRALMAASVRDLITTGKLTMEQVVNSTIHEGCNLAIAGDLITNGTLTVEQVLGLTYAASDALGDEGVRDLISAGTLTIEQVLRLTDSASEALRDEGVRDLISAGTLTIEQVLRLTDSASEALRDEDVQDMLRNGEITIERIFALTQEVVHINDAQSTHTTSVHQAVSESATKLADRYPEIDGLDLENVISRVQSYVEGLPDDSEKNKAAKRCILRITDPDYTFTDTGSQITTRQLLALSFLAINDENSRVGTLEDATAQFVEGLYEIQRGYNLSDTGVDQGGRDRSICSAGTFNKFIEKMQGIDPDCTIRYITSDTASLKLPIVVQEEAMQYLASLASPSTSTEYQAFTRLMSQVKKDGVEVIWDKIKDQITARMFDEYGSLYQDREDSRFTGLIEAGQYTELPDLTRFEEQVQSSNGYHQYCSRVPQEQKRSRSFFSPPENPPNESADSRSGNRHNSPEDQLENDDPQLDSGSRPKI